MEDIPNLPHLPNFGRSISPDPPVLVNPQTVFEDEKLRVIVKRENYKRNRRFHVHDHSYGLIIEKKDPSQADLYLKSSFYPIQEGIKAILTILRDYYTRRAENAPNNWEGNMLRVHDHQGKKS